MRILIVSEMYPPIVSSAANLMQELTQWLVKKNHQVAVATTYPKYYLDKNAKKKIKSLSRQDGALILRIKTLPLKKINLILRGISQLILPYLFWHKIKKIKGNIDVVIVYSPVITLGLVGKKVKKRFNAKFILNLQDIFPQNAIDLGLLKNKFAIKLFEYIEEKNYENADKITFHSKGGRKFLINKKHVAKEKIHTIPNWIDLEPYKNLDSRLSFRKKYNLENKFIFLFAGIMGPAQGLELLVKLAEKISDLKDIVFLLVGDGKEKEKIKKHNLKNIIIKPFINREDYPYLVKDSDVGIVCLSPKNKTPFIPGKFLGYLASSKPVIAFLNQESDGFSLIKEAQCGFASRSDDMATSEQIIRRIYNHKNLDQLGKNGFAYAERHLSMGSCLKRLEKLFF